MCTTRNNWGRSETKFQHSFAFLSLSTTFSQALANATNVGLNSFDAELLLLFSTCRKERGRAWLRANHGALLALADEKRFTENYQRRLNGEPLAYITGQRGFYGLDLHIDARVLDPRPDTETLVEWALDVIRTTAHPHIIDLGTGSGAIALAIQFERRDSHLTAVDASSDALVVARANAERLQLPVLFVQGSWLMPMLFTVNSDSTSIRTNDATEPRASRFDLIVSNPPYIAEGDSHLQALVHEPIQALTSGPDGLDAIRQITAQSPGCLKPGGWLLLEHGHDQAEAVTHLLRKQGFVNVQSRKDLAGIARCTGGQWMPGADEA